MTNVRVFPGQAWAASHEPALEARVGALSAAQGIHLTIAAILFSEDQGSQLYTRLKREAASRVGIEYQVFTFSLRDPVVKVQETLSRLAAEPSITGIIIQKPWRQTWLSVQTEVVPKAAQAHQFLTWWQQLTRLIPVTKDVDGLVAKTWNTAAVGRSVILPATCRAVIEIMNAIDHCRLYAVESPLELPPEVQNRVRHSIKPELVADRRVAVIGKSDLLGYPLATWLQTNQVEVTLMGKKELQAHLAKHSGLQDFSVVVSATGQAGLIQPDWLATDGVFIDVGEPKSDLDKTNINTLTGWMTPVPGGVGPLTVVSLLENCVELV